jgi:opacity protein-like surface antigen
MKPAALTFFTIVLFTLRVQSQTDIHIPDSLHIQIITMSDGTKLQGRTLEIFSSEIRFETSFGMCTLAKEKISNVEEIPLSLLTNGEYWFENPNATRLFFGPTAFTLKQSKGYIADYYVFFPAIAYGITDDITIAGGSSIFPGIDFDEQIFYVAPKIGLATSENLSLAAGALLIQLPNDINKHSTIGVIYGVGTYGNTNESITLGIGYGYSEKTFTDKPMVMLGGEKRISKNFAFVSENWMFPDINAPMVSYGIRFFGESLSVDFAFVTPVDENFLFPGIPYIDFAYTF